MINSIDYIEDIQFIEVYPTENSSSNNYISKRSNLLPIVQKLQNLRHKNSQQTKKKNNPLNLKYLVTKGKVKILRDNFIRKMKRSIIKKTLTQNIVQSQKQQSLNFLQTFQSFLQSKEGIYLSPMLHCIWSLINIIQIAMIIIIYSLTLTFPQAQNLSYFRYIRIFSLILYIIDMVLNFFTQKHQIVGGVIRNLRQIASSYLSKGFAPDFFSIFMYPISICFKAGFLELILIVIAFVKLNNNLEKFQKFEYIYVGTNQKQHYYGIVKVFILNFSIGHLLSILLNLMAQVNQSQQNWYNKIDIRDSTWYVKYLWGYYWGTNIMLTVGFGDLCAQNSTQAFFLIFIQTISCITLAYNISCVGSIISNMKSENQDKKKKVKYFHKMCQQYKISEQLQQKINNFIEESYQIKKSFQFQEYQQVLSSLPKVMQSQYRTQSNQILFEVGFFKSLNKKTILNLAESITRKIAHPEQLLKKKGQISNFCLLEKGVIGFACRNGAQSALNGVVIQKYQIGQNQQPKILTLDFIKRKLLKFDIKSLFYSIIYYLQQESFMKILKNCQMDYQFLLAMRDKEQTLLGNNQIYKCENCTNEFHSKFDCPKYHYISLKSLVISKYEKRQSKIKQNRSDQQVQRHTKIQKTLFMRSVCEEEHQRFLNELYDEDQLRQIKNQKIYYNQKMLEGNRLPSQKQFNFLSFQARQQTFQKQMRKIQEIIVNSTNKILDFWGLQTDLAHNFKYYFKQYNSNRLIKLKLSSTKKKPKDMIFGALAFKKQANPFFLKPTF